MKRLRTSFLLGAGLVFAVACARQYGQPLATSHMNTKPSSDGGADASKGDGILAQLFGLKDKAIGPFLARSESGGVIAYVGSALEDKTRPIVVMAVTSDGQAKGEAHVVAHAPTDTNALLLRKLGGPKPVYVAAWSALTDRGEGLTALTLGEDGVPIGAPTELARTVDDIVWVEIVPTGKGAVCVWAEETTGNDANVFALALDPQGRPRGVPSRVARGITAWQATATPTGVGLGLVRQVTTPARPDDKKKKDTTTSSLTWTALDDSGRTVGEPAVVSSGGTYADFDVARAGDAYVFAWTDASKAEPQMLVAGIDAGGKVVAQHEVVLERGGSSFVAVTGSAEGALIAWEEPKKRERPIRRAHLAKIDPATLRATRETTLELQGGAALELRTTATGYAVLGMGHPCAPSQPREACLQTPNAPLYVRLDAMLAAVQVDGLVGSEHPALGWGLDCAGDQCLALAANAESPTLVYGVDLSARPGAHRALLQPPAPDDAPRMTALATIDSGASLSDVAVARIGTTTLVATVAAAADDGKGAAGSALEVRTVDAGVAGPKTVLSTRALAMGGVAISAAKNADDGAIVVWVARENGDPQVHVTRIDKRGKKQNDVQLTTATGDASDVSATAVDGGWVVAWVDGRDGNGEVYATRIDKQLQRAGREERITTAPGDATDTALLALDGDAVLLAWSDPRESPQDGFADVYTAIISAKSAKKSGNETRILSTAAHSRSPSLARTESGATLAWIEEAPVGSASADARGAMLAPLDRAGKLAADPTKIRLPREGVVTGIVADTSTGTVHAVVARSTPDELWLDAVGPTQNSTLLALDGPPSLDVAMALIGTELFFGDEGPEASDRRTRRCVIDWRK